MKGKRERERERGGESRKGALVKRTVTLHYVFNSLILQCVLGQSFVRTLQLVHDLMGL